MENVLLTLTVTGAALFAGLASAETDNALFPSNNAFAHVTFHRTSSTDSAPLATVMVNNSPFAPTIDNVEAATYITVVHEDDNYTFALAESGKNKNDVWFVIPDGSAAVSHVSTTGTMSLTTLMDGLSVDPMLLERLQGDSSGS